MWAICGTLRVPVDRLAAGHRDRVVVENLVGDVDAGGDRLPHRQRTGMEERAVAEVLEHVLGFGERRLPRPGDAFAAHVGEGVGVAIHPRHHVVAADAAERARAFRHHRGGVVRTAAAIVRHAREAGARQRELGFLVLHPAQALLDGLVAGRAGLKQALDAAADHAGDGAGVSSPVDGRIHSPASSYLPTMEGRWPALAGQL